MWAARGQGKTPLKEALHLIKKDKPKFPGSIKYEYNTPEGSGVVIEVKAWLEYCKNALA
jgi:hypothetical protein